MVLGGLPPVVRVRLNDLLLDREGDPQRTRVVVRRRIGQVDLSVRSSTAVRRGGLGFLILLGRELDGVPLGIGADLGELGAADDLEEDRLVLAGDVGVAGTLGSRSGSSPRSAGSHRCTSAPGRKWKVIWVASSLYSHDSAAAGTVSWLVSSRVRPSYTSCQNVDLVGEGALLGIDDIRVDLVMDAQDFASSWAAVPVASTGTMSEKTATIAASFTQ